MPGSVLNIPGRFLELDNHHPRQGGRVWGRRRRCSLEAGLWSARPRGWYAAALHLPQEPGHGRCTRSPDLIIMSACAPGVSKKKLFREPPWSPHSTSQLRARIPTLKSVDCVRRTLVYDRATCGRRLSQRGKYSASALRYSENVNTCKHMALTIFGVFTFCMHFAS